MGRFPGSGAGGREVGEAVLVGAIAALDVETSEDVAVSGVTVF